MKSSMPSAAAPSEEIHSSSSSCEQQREDFPVNHKTVILVDHSLAFGQSSNELFSLDNIGSSKHASAGSKIQPFSKSLWTCAVEAVLEYCRIVLDLFPSEEKVFSLVSADDEARVLTAWFNEDQVYDQLLKVFKDEGPPSATRLCLNSAIAECMTMLMYLTSRQAAVLDKPGLLKNRARVLLLTQFESDEAVNDFALTFVKEIKARNSGKIANNYTEYQVHHCDLVLVCVHPVGADPVVTERDGVRFGDLLRLSVHTSPSGEALARRLVNLTRTHYVLASTCVQDIPMKEETPAAGQQQSNRNYDVELIHEAAAHADLLAMGAFDAMSVRGEHLVFPESLGLKWLTPKNQAVELLSCTRACRVTAADVTARHSVCLINFLRGPPSRFVMLESKTSASAVPGRRGTAHMLASHGGDIFLHVLEPGRPLLDELPAAAEARAGATRVTDYRVADFREVIKRSRLLPARETGDYQTLPRERALRHLERSTLYWPLTINDSVLLSASSCAKSLLSLLSEESLEEDEIKACENLVKKFLDMEARGEPVSVSNRSLKAAKREDLYRLLFAELDLLLCRYATVSPGHAQVLAFLRRFRPPEPVTQPTGLAFLDAMRAQFQQQHLSSSPSGCAGPASPTAAASTATASATSSEPPAAKRLRLLPLASAPAAAPSAAASSSAAVAGLTRTGQSLQDWHEAGARVSAAGRRPDFQGRAACQPGEVYPLYQHLQLAAAAAAAVAVTTSATAASVAASASQAPSSASEQQLLQQQRSKDPRTYSLSGVA